MTRILIATLAALALTFADGTPGDVPAPQYEGGIGSAIWIEPDGTVTEAWPDGRTFQGGIGTASSVTPDGEIAER